MFSVPEVFKVSLGFNAKESTMTAAMRLQDSCTKSLLNERLLQGSIVGFVS